MYFQRSSDTETLRYEGDDMQMMNEVLRHESSDVTVSDGVHRILWDSEKGCFYDEATRMGSMVFIVYYDDNILGSKTANHCLVYEWSQVRAALRARLSIEITGIKFFSSTGCFALKCNEGRIIDSGFTPGVNYTQETGVGLSDVDIRSLISCMEAYGDVLGIEIGVQDRQEIFRLRNQLEALL